MVGAHHAQVGVAEEGAAAHRRPQARKKSDREVERARGEGAGDVLDIQRHRFEPHARCDALQALDQRRQELDLAEVRHVEPERARRGGRIEARAVRERRFQQGERLSHRLAELARERRRVHAVGRAHEERVAEERAQPRERVGDRGLREPQPRGGRGDAAILQHRVEGAQQVEIDVLHIHGND